MHIVWITFWMACIGTVTRSFYYYFCLRLFLAHWPPARLTSVLYRSILLAAGLTSLCQKCLLNTLSSRTVLVLCGGLMSKNKQNIQEDLNKKQWTRRRKTRIEAPYWRVQYSAENEQCSGSVSFLYGSLSWYPCSDFTYPDPTHLPAVVHKNSLKTPHFADKKSSERQILQVTKGRKYTYIRLRIIHLVT
jgi:hypothetical protein